MSLHVIPWPPDWLHKMQEITTAQPMETIPEVARIPGAEERNVTIDDVTWRYWYAGSGPPLLLIHGFMGYSFSWRFNVKTLSQHFSVYALDLPGCGFSQRTQVPECTIAGDAERVLGFMDYFSLEEADLVGSSRGGGLAVVLGASLAKRNMLHRIRRLILVSPINPWSSNGRLLTRMFATRIGGKFVLRVLPKLDIVLTRYFKRLYGDPKRISPGSIEGYEAGLDLSGSFEHLLRIVKSWHDDLALIGQSLPAISELPTLLLWGSRDKAVFPSSIHQLQSRLKNCALVLMRGVGHLPYEEVPDEFNRVVCDFLLRDIPATPLAMAGAQQASSAVSTTSVQLES
jgi:pimeloyl-ACP methyl ester carboxylesterase